MKNAITERIIGGKPNTMPLVIGPNGKNPSPALPPPTITSAPYMTSNIMEIPEITCGIEIDIM
jgi:hypothetical protein